MRNETEMMLKDYPLLLSERRRLDDFVVGFQKNLNFENSFGDAFFDDLKIFLY